MNQHARLEPIPFIDVNAQRKRLGRALDNAIARVLTHCQFIMGPEVKELESQLAAFCGARHAITCANGTDALLLVLMAKSIGPGDAVFCPSYTFALRPRWWCWSVPRRSCSTWTRRVSISTRKA